LLSLKEKKRSLKNDEKKSCQLPRFQQSKWQSLIPKGSIHRAKFDDDSGFFL
jgi:hypothetical protein